jgi:hypothetical protein
VLLAGAVWGLLTPFADPEVENETQHPLKRDMLGWPLHDISPDEERQSRVRSIPALREATAEQETKVTALREELAGATVPETKKQELEHQEAILTFLKKRLEELLRPEAAIQTNIVIDDLGTGHEAQRGTVPLMPDESYEAERQAIRSMSLIDDRPKK